MSLIINLPTICSLYTKKALDSTISIYTIVYTQLQTFVHLQPELAGVTRLSANCGHQEIFMI